jgi:hypothetical protein
MPRYVARDSQLRARHRAMPHGGERRLNRIRCSPVLPVLCREAVERKQFVAVLGKFLGGLRILGRIRIEDDEDWRFFAPGMNGRDLVIEVGKIDPWSLS